MLKPMHNPLTRAGKAPGRGTGAARCEGQSSSTPGDSAVCRAVVRAGGVMGRWWFGAIAGTAPGG